MSLPSNLLSSKISDVHRFLVTGKITPTQLCEICLKRANQTKQLNGLVTITSDEAFSQAEKSSQRYATGKQLGILDGIPIAVKDNFMTKGIATTCASKMLENFIPPYSATVVEKLTETHGSLLMGKTNLDEFAMGCGGVDSIFGPCYNPWKSGLPFQAIDSTNNHNIVHSNEEKHDANEWFISGGSSGGSAVAVASGIVYAALGSDTGGSVRNPAAHCGIVGFKPSYGTCSRYGLVPLTHSMDTVAIMSRTVDDVEIVFKAIQGWDVKDSTSSRSNSYQPLGTDFPINQLTIGLPSEYLPDFISPEIRSLLYSTVDLLKSKGISVIPVSLPHTPYSLSCYSIINRAEVASNLACYDGIQYGHRSGKVLTSKNANNLNNKTNHSSHSSTPKTTLSSSPESPKTSSNDNNSLKTETYEDLIRSSRDEAFGEKVKSRIMSGNYFLLKENYDNFFLRALKVRRLIVNDFDKVFNQQKIDLLLTPVTLTSSCTYSEWNRKDTNNEDYCTQPANLAGLPALSLPCALSKSTSLPLALQIVGPRYHDNIVIAFARYLENLLSFPKLVYKGDEKVFN